MEDLIIVLDLFLIIANVSIIFSRALLWIVQILFAPFAWIIEVTVLQFPSIEDASRKLFYTITFILGWILCVFRAILKELVASFVHIYSDGWIQYAIHLFLVQVAWGGCYFLVVEPFFKRLNESVGELGRAACSVPFSAVVVDGVAKTKLFKITILATVVLFGGLYIDERMS